MRAARVRGNQIEVADVGEAIGEGVTVHVRATGICGSDLHLLASGGFDGRILGHEIAGLTDDGTPVAVEPVDACGACLHCLDGDEPLCAEATTRLIGIGVDGGLAERVVVPSHLLVPLADGVRVEDACLVEPLAVGVRAVARAGVTARCAPGGTVGIPSTYWEAVRLPPMLLGLKEVNLVPSSMYGRTTAEGRDVVVAARILAEQPEIATALVSHRFPLDGAPDAFAVAADRAAGAIKVVIEPAT